MTQRNRWTTVYIVSGADKMNNEGKYKVGVLNDVSSPCIYSLNKLKKPTTQIKWDSNFAIKILYCYISLVLY